MPADTPPPKTPLTVDDLIERLGLEPHPEEGGWFRETYRSVRPIPSVALPSGYEGDRAHSTAIYYLLAPGAFSHLHRLRSDEVFHFYLGDPCEMLLLHPGGDSEVVSIGSDLTAGMRLQLVVPAGTWQGMRLVDGGRYALLGCTVAPGFEYVDYDHGDRDGLLEGWPDRADLIRALTGD